MNTKNRKLEAKSNRRKLKLPSGLVLLATPDDPANDFKCVRCGWEWPARKDVKNDGMPARCPHCSSPSWNKNRTVSRNKGMKCHCRHCGWTWTAVKPDEPPVMCPHCRRYEWNEKPTPKPTTK